jgi:hypothetical protein
MTKKPHVEEKAKTKKDEKFKKKVKKWEGKITGEDLLKAGEELRKKFNFGPKVKVVDTKSKPEATGSGYKFYAGGGRAIKGLGRAFLKGGKVK